MPQVRRGMQVLFGIVAAVTLGWSAPAAGQQPAAPESPTLLPPVLVTAPPLYSSSSEQLIPGKSTLINRWGSIDPTEGDRGVPVPARHPARRPRAVRRAQADREATSTVRSPARVPT